MCAKHDPGRRGRAELRLEETHQLRHADPVGQGRDPDLLQLHRDDPAQREGQVAATVGAQVMVGRSCPRSAKGRTATARSARSRRNASGRRPDIGRLPAGLGAETRRVRARTTSRSRARWRGVGLPSPSPSRVRSRPSRRPRSSGAPSPSRRPAFRYSTRSASRTTSAGSLLPTMAVRPAPTMISSRRKRRMSRAPTGSRPRVGSSSNSTSGSPSRPARQRQPLAHAARVLAVAAFRGRPQPHPGQQGVARARSPSARPKPCRAAKNFRFSRPDSAHMKLRSSATTRATRRRKALLVPSAPTS